MNEDIPMDEDPQPDQNSGEGLGQYDLENYDDEDAMPGAFECEKRTCICTDYSISDGSLQ